MDAHEAAALVEQVGAERLLELLELARQGKLPAQRTRRTKSGRSSGAVHSSTKCPRCSGPCDVASRTSCPSYNRSIITGTRTCRECDGEGCDECGMRGYAYRFGKVSYDYACRACVAELASRGTGHAPIYT